MKPALFGVAVAAMALGGAATASAQPEAIPALRPEGARPPPPGPNFVWEPGHWRWNHGYRWVEGHYVRRGRGWNRFVRGHWERHRGEWVWMPGRWD